MKISPFTQKIYRESRLDKIHEFIKKYRFGTMVTLNKDNEMICNSLPFLLKEKDSEYGTIYSHVSLHNSIHYLFEKDELREKPKNNSIVIFNGPNGYISPKLYKEELVYSRIPTWNYSTIQIYGIPKVIKDEDEILLKELLKIEEEIENGKENQWTKPEDKIMDSRMVWFKIDILKINAKFKLSQNSYKADRENIIENLKNKELSHFMKEYYQSKE